jgi:uncharacterized protein (DUF1778 family)
MKDETTICFRATAAQRDAIERLAKINHRSVSDQIRSMIAAAAKVSLGHAARERAAGTNRNRRAGRGELT